MALDPTDVLQSVVIDNLKTVAGAPSVSLAQLFQVTSNATGILVQEAVASAGRRSGLMDIAMGEANNQMINLDPNEAISAAREMTASAGGDIASLLVQVTGAIAGLQQAVKGAQTTPPTTP